MIPIKENTTFADLHLKWVSKIGIRHVILSVGHCGDQIRDYCKDGSRWDLKIDYLEDGPTLIGTGGAVRQSLQWDYQELCITYGDTLLNFSFYDFLESYYKTSAQGIMTILENQLVGHVSNSDFQNPWVIYHKEKPALHWKYIDYGFMLLKRNLIEKFSKSTPLDLSEPLTQASVEKKILGFLVTERFWEIGSLESLTEFKGHF